MGRDSRARQNRGLPRLLWIEGEFHAALVQAEFEFVEQLAADIRSGTLEGLEWWRQAHESGTARNEG